MVSREVNVNRPEHSWIPFYRELAEKLVDPEENWRSRQDELAELMREMARDSDFGVPEGVARSRDPFMDPFTLFAAFNNSAKGQKKLLVIQRIKDFFGLKSEILHASYYTPEVVSVWIEFFGDYEITEGHASDSETHWDTFEFVLSNDPFAESTDREKLLRLFEASLGVYGVAISSLSAACYWVNPRNYLHYETINGIIGDDVIKKTDDAATYLSEFERAIAIDARPFPEINDEIYLRDHEPLRHPKVWLVRGGRNEHAVSEFLAQNRAGIGFGLQDDELSNQKTRSGIRSIYKERNPSASNQRVGQNVGQVANFILEMQVGDHVIMPDGDSFHCGAVVSKPYRKPGVAYENSRDIAWKKVTVPRADLPGLPPRRTVAEVTGSVKDSFLAIIGHPYSKATRYKMPEDTWVPFHLEIVEKLAEGEWWLAEKREALGDMIEKVRWSDPEEVSDDYEHIQWAPDPYSFFLSFNMRTDGTKRLPGYRKVQELLDVGANVPDADHRVRGLGTHFRFTNTPADDDIDALWDFFRFAMGFEPAGDEGAAEFVEKYDRVIKVNGFVGQWDITLSYWLYWIDPRKYLLTRRIRRQELGLAAELGLPEHISGGEQYLEALRATRSLAESKGRILLDINRDTTTREMLGLDPIIGPSGNAYDVDAMLDDGVFLEASEIERMLRILQTKKNLILQGPPGVGKTFIARKLAYVLMGEKSERAEKRITSVQFHQSYSYEEFVGGIRPDVEDGQMVFTRQDGPFLQMCAMARANPDDDYLMLIDEINRGNLSRVFGELLMLIESDKRNTESSVTLQHRSENEDTERFFVPNNVYIIGTMNLADKSLTGMNVAMRRRFGFYDLEPQFGESVFKDWLSKTEMPQEMQDRINSKLSKLNTAISKDDSLDFNYAVGHSFFCPPQNEPVDDWDAWYETVVDYEIRPLLREYWFDDPERANDEADKLKKME